MPQYDKEHMNMLLEEQRKRYIQDPVILALQESIATIHKTAKPSIVLKESGIDIQYEAQTENQISHIKTLIIRHITDNYSLLLTSEIEQ